MTTDVTKMTGSVRRWYERGKRKIMDQIEQEERETSNNIKILQRQDNRHKSSKKPRIEGK